MIYGPKVGEEVVLRYKDHAHAFHGRTGRIAVVSTFAPSSQDRTFLLVHYLFRVRSWKLPASKRRPSRTGPRNVGVRIDGRIVVVPMGNLFRVNPSTRGES